MKYAGTLAAAVTLALTAASSLGDGGRAAKGSAATPSPPREALEASGAAPDDLRIEVEATASRLLVRATRPGHLVALLGGGARAAGEGVAKLAIDRGALAEKGTRAALAKGAAIAWESTRLGEITVERGAVTVVEDGDRVAGKATSAGSPKARESWKGKHHACAAYEDPFTGFAVLCRFDRTARQVEAASLWTTWPKDDVAVATRKSETTVRLDLPLEGPSDADAPVAEAAVASFHVGRTGFALTIDATHLPGEARAITASELSRDQPLASDEDAQQAIAQGNNRRALLSSRSR